MSQKTPYLDLDAATTLAINSVTTAATLAGLDTTYAKAIRCDLYADISSIRYGFNYTPSASVGHKLAGGSSLTLYGYGEMKKFQHITGGATDAVIYATYKYPQGQR